MKEKRIKELQQQLGIIALNIFFFLKDFELTDEEIQAFNKITDRLKESKETLEKLSG